MTDVKLQPDRNKDHRFGRVAAVFEKASAGFPSTPLFSRHALRCFLLIATAITCVILMTAYDVRWESGDLALHILPLVFGLYLFGNFIRWRCQLSLLSLLLLVAGICIGLGVFLPRYSAAQERMRVINELREQRASVVLGDAAFLAFLEEFTGEGFFRDVDSVEITKYGPIDSKLAALHRLDSVRKVILPRVAINDNRARKLGLISGIESLDISQDRITPKTFAYLRDAEALRELRLRNMYARGYHGFQVYSEGGLINGISQLKQLESLSLDCAFGFQSLDGSELARLPNLAKLALNWPHDSEEYPLDQCALTELAKSDSIRVLALNGCCLTEAHFGILAKIGSLQTIKLRPCGKPVDGLSMFKKLRPDVNVDLIDHQVE